MNATTKVSCACGNTVIAVTGEPIDQFYCHCTNCQKANAAPYAAVVLYPADAFRVVRGAMKSWTLVSMPRSFCKRCGNSVFAAPFDDVRGVNGFLLPPSVFRPKFHQHCHTARLPVKDSLPHYRGFPPKFGGTDEEASW